MFNSPLAWCPVARCYVALDEPRPECAARNQCVTERCPLARFFFSAKNGAASPDGTTTPERERPANSVAQ